MVCSPEVRTVDASHRIHQLSNPPRVYSVVPPQGKACLKVCNGCRRMLKNVSRIFFFFNTLVQANIFFFSFSRALTYP